MNKPKSTDKGNKKDRRRNEIEEKSMRNLKRNSQPVISPLIRKENHSWIRRELSYPLDNRGTTGEEPENTENIRSTEKRKEEHNKTRKNSRTNTIEKNSAKKRKEVGSNSEKDTPDVWSKVVSRRARKRSTREETNFKDGANSKDRKNMVKEQTKKRKPYKTSAIVITTNDKNVSYSEVLAWASQNHKIKRERNELPFHQEICDRWNLTGSKRRQQQTDRG